MVDNDNDDRLAAGNINLYSCHHLELACHVVAPRAAAVEPPLKETPGGSSKDRLCRTAASNHTIAILRQKTKERENAEHLSGH